MSKEQTLAELLQKIEKKISKMDPVSVEDMPTVPLYMDQLTTLMDAQLRTTLRRPSEDKVLTKTMINNYAKNDLIPPPLKKKYSKDHLYELVFIFYFKNFLSIGDIQTMLSPLTADFFGKSKEKGYGLEEIYNEVVTMGRGARKNLNSQLHTIYDIVGESFNDVPAEKREYLRKFAFICELAYDIFLKKYIIEQMIDEIAEEYVVERDGGYEDELRRKAAKEATLEAKRVAKMREDKLKTAEKIRQEKLRLERGLNPEKSRSVLNKNYGKKI